MATLTFSLRHSSSKPFELVYNSLLDFRTFGRLHPCMKKVEVVEQNSDGVTYAIEEVVYIFGLFKIKPVYRASVSEPEKNRCLQYTSQVKKHVHLCIRFTFADKGHGKLEVQEDIEVNCNRLVGLVFLGILKKSHLEVFRNLNLEKAEVPD